MASEESWMCNILEKPVCCIRSRTIRCLELLDIITENTSSAGYPSNYKGLGELMGYTMQDISVIGKNIRVHLCRQQADGK